MKYEISNTVLRRKPEDMHRVGNLFPKGTKCAVIGDDPQSLFKVWRKGFSIKPHAPQDDEGDLATSALILDFDNLSKEQAERVMKIYAGKTDAYADYSAGTRSRLEEHMDDPGYVNPKWGVKAFVKIPKTLVSKDEIERRYVEILCFLNRCGEDKLRPVWDSWKRANNDKEKTASEIFSGWILPDVQMLNAFRTQITYGTNSKVGGTRQKFETEKIAGRLAADGIQAEIGSCTAKADWPEGLWRIDETIETQEQPKADEEQTERLEKAFEQAARKYGSRDRPSLPGADSKAEFGRFKKEKGVKPVFEDLVVSQTAIELNKVLWYNRFKEDRPMPKNFSAIIAREIGLRTQVLIFNWYEMKRQGLLSDEQTLEEEVAKNVVIWTKKKHTYGIYVDMKQGKGGSYAKAFAKAFCKIPDEAAYERLRLESKSKTQGFSEATKCRYEALKKCMAKEVWLAYREQREQDKLTADRPSPYVFKSYQLRVEVLANEAVADKTKIDNRREWLEWVKTREPTITLEDETIKKYFDKIYIREWNEHYPDEPVEIRRSKHKQHRSKWDEMFEGKSKDEILAIIKALDCSEPTKSRLRKRYVA